MSSNNAKSVILFRIGVIGYVASFLGWFTWFLFVFSNLIVYALGYSGLSIMYGIYFRSGGYSIIVYGFFLASFVLSSFACFELKRKYKSKMALLCGLVYVVSFAIVSYSAISIYFLKIYTRMNVNFLASLNAGMLVWGATLLEVRKFLPYLKLSSLAGFIFIFIAILTLTWFWQFFLYWCVESWFMLFEWLHAIGNLASAHILYRLSKIM